EPLGLHRPEATEGRRSSHHPGSVGQAMPEGQRRTLRASTRGSPKYTKGPLTRALGRQVDWVRAALERHRAVAARGVHPVALDEVLTAAESDVVLGAVGRRRRGAEGPRALVGVLGATAVVPGVEVGVGDRLLGLVGDDRRHAVGAGVAIGSGGLRLTRARAA